MGRERAHRTRWGRASLMLGGLAGVVCLSAAVAWTGHREAPLPTRLVMDEALLARLQTLAEGLHKEIVLCLQGEIDGDVATADSFVMPAPRLSTPTRSSFDACPPGTLASWHNHPHTFPPRPLSGSRSYASLSEATARWLCVLSETDIGTGNRLGHPFVVVSVDASTWCWWSLDEVQAFARDEVSPGPPSPERLALRETGASWARPALDREKQTNAAPEGVGPSR